MPPMWMYLPIFLVGLLALCVIRRDRQASVSAALILADWIAGYSSRHGLEWMANHGFLIYHQQDLWMWSGIIDCSTAVAFILFHTKREAIVGALYGIEALGHIVYGALLLTFGYSLAVDIHYYWTEFAFAWGQALLFTGWIIHDGFGGGRRNRIKDRRNGRNSNRRVLGIASRFYRRV